MEWIRPGLAVLVFGALLVGPPAEAQTPEAQVEAGASAEISEIITPTDIYNRIYFLASDALRGRDTPSAGLEAAAAYLVSEHRRMGLEPAGEDGTFYQRFPFQLQGMGGDDTVMSLGQLQMHLGVDFFFMGGSNDPVSGSLAYVSGVEEPADRPDLSGTVAVFSLPGMWSQPLLQEAARQASLAEEAGAHAVIHLLSPDFSEENVQQVADGMAQPRWGLGSDPAFPQVFLTRPAADRGFAGATPSLEEFLATAERGESFHSVVSDVGLQASLAPNIIEQAYPPNVIAKLPGSDPVLRDEYIVLSAHFDHVGVGQPRDGDSIYNGADDNASGTAALLEVARALKALPEAPRRTVVFAHVSAEEKGLLGSEWFVDNPTIPLENAVANINADMVGSDTHADTVVIIGKEYSTLGALVEEVNAGLPELGLVASPDLWPEERLFFRSDQYHFMRKEIPSLFFFTGLHECYHRPCDTPDFIDPDKAARIARLLTHTVLEIANRDERPEWYTEGLEEVRQMTGGR